jgi:hypothetical protein
VRRLAVAAVAHQQAVLELSHSTTQLQDAQGAWLPMQDAMADGGILKLWRLDGSLRCRLSFNFPGPTTGCRQDKHQAEM